MNKHSISANTILVGVLVLLFLVLKGEAGEQWSYLAKGVEYCNFHIKSLQGSIDQSIHVVRIDPTQAELKLILSSEYDKKLHTAAEWCTKFNLIAAINAGMYQADLSTNVGYLKNGSYIQNEHWNKYKSVLAFGPKRTGVPTAIMVDIDTPDTMKILKDYNSVIQNLRLRKGNGTNVWGRSQKKWSEAAVGIDNDGRILFLFSRSELTMTEFNNMVNSIGLGVIKMMHVEGGPLASLSIRAKNIALDLGGYDSTISSITDTLAQWPIPNIIGVQMK
jgi:hypothetical protein